MAKDSPTRGTLRIKTLDLKDGAKKKTALCLAWPRIFFTQGEIYLILPLRWKKNEKNQNESCMLSTWQQWCIWLKACLRRCSVTLNQNEMWPAQPQCHSPASSLCWFVQLWTSMDDCITVYPSGTAAVTLDQFHFTAVPMAVFVFPQEWCDVCTSPHSFIFLSVHCYHCMLSCLGIF